MTTSVVETKDEKLALLGYVPATRPGKCCLCGKQVGQGEYIGKLPDGWQPKSRPRWAHRRTTPATCPPGIEGTVNGLDAADLRRAACASADLLAEVSTTAAMRCPTELPAAMARYVTRVLAT
jgi:hypothetical protein